MAIATQYEMREVILEIRITTQCIREYLLFGKRDIELPPMTPSEFEQMESVAWRLQQYLKFIEGAN